MLDSLQATLNTQYPLSRNIKKIYIKSISTSKQAPTPALTGSVKQVELASWQGTEGLSLLLTSNQNKTSRLVCLKN